MLIGLKHLVCAILWFVLSSTIGCNDEKTLCDRLCHTLMEAEEDYADDFCGGFEDGRAAVGRQCVSACDDAWSDLSGSDKGDVKRCMDCVIDELGGSIDYQDVDEALGDCEDECDDDDIVDFWNTFIDDWFNDIDYEDQCVGGGSDLDVDMDIDADTDVDADADVDADTDADPTPAGEKIGAVGGSIALSHASLGVPPNAIAEGGSATYTIEKVTTPPSGLPAGVTIAGDGAKLSPEGIVFANPVEVTLAVPAGVSEPGDLAIMRHDGAKWEFVGGALFDEGDARGTVTQGIRAYVNKFSGYWPGTIPGWKDATANVRFVNDSLSIWYNVCIQSYTLTNPTAFPNIISPQWEVPVAPYGTIGWSNKIRSSLPAGTYNFQYYVSSSESCVKDLPPVNFGSSPYNNPIDYTISPGSGTTVAGYCDCKQQPTPPIGEGALQVTLSWNSDVDLDLYVETPSGEEIYFGHDVGAAGGKLDIDDTCWDDNGPGGPENVFWSSSAPSGEYVVSVYYYSACEQSVSPNWTLRVNAGGAIIKSLTGTATTTGEKIEVTRFTY